jgi:hypothetical protein
MLNIHSREKLEGDEKYVNPRRGLEARRSTRRNNKVSSFS